jgi:hypothetical protein
MTKNRKWWRITQTPLHWPGDDAPFWKRVLFFFAGGQIEEQ